tara:strand:+ start:446 stop:1636 length:1191 start_codon:yes stop_codon:yes gene_type:complete
MSFSLIKGLYLSLSLWAVSQLVLAQAPLSPALEALLDQNTLEKELSRHGLTRGSVLGGSGNRLFVTATGGSETTTIIINEIDPATVIFPADDETLLGMVDIVWQHTPPEAESRVYHIVLDHPLPMAAWSASGITGIAHANIAPLHPSSQGDAEGLGAVAISSSLPASVEDIRRQTAQRQYDATPYAQYQRAAINELHAQRHAAMTAQEQALESQAHSIGLVYRAPEFWSSFTYSDDLRQIFYGEGGSPTLALRFLTGWVPARVRTCGSDDDASQIEWPDGPYFRRIASDAPNAELFPTENRLSVPHALLPAFEIVAAVPILSEPLVNQALAQNGARLRLIAAELDAARLMVKAGCNSATSSQFEQNLLRTIMKDASLQDAGVSITNAEEESDAPPS